MKKILILALGMAAQSALAAPPKIQLQLMPATAKPMVVINKSQDCKTDPDHDRDGTNSMSCGGNDCDDNDRTRSPGTPEICDTVGKDEDCDPMTGGLRDQDRDGFIDTRCKNVDQSGAVSVQGNDCDDQNYEVQPGTIKCASRTDYHYCMADARVIVGKCQAPLGYCAPQPNGLGICIPTPAGI